MYLPPGQTADQRSAIHEAFDQYTQVVLPLVQEYGGKIHWAKIEPPGASPSVAPKKAEEGWWDVLFGCKCKQETNAGELIRGTLERYPLGQFNNYRLALDPREILLNDRLRNLVVDEKTRRRSLD